MGWIDGRTAIMSTVAVCAGKFFGNALKLILEQYGEMQVVTTMDYRAEHFSEFCGENNAPLTQYSKKTYWRE